MDIRILYLDDEKSNLEAFKASFRTEFQVFTANNSEEALQILKSELAISVVLSDQKMPVTTGLDFFKKLKSIYPETVRILITGFADKEILAQAINEGAVFKYVEKPWDESILKMHILEGHRLWQLRNENLELAKKLIEKNRELQSLLVERLTPPRKKA